MELDGILHAIAAHIGSNDGFTIVAHTSPDGDTLGSSLALYCALTALHKKAEVVCDYPVPSIYAFLPNADKVKAGGAALGYPTAIAVDCADVGRMGEAAKLFRGAAFTVNIDHHATNAGYAALNAVDPAAAAVGELIHALIGMIPGAALDRDAATCLYAAIMTDTGNFAYSNTTAATFMTAARLMEHGIDISSINRRIYRSIPYHKQKLLGRALNNMRLFCDGRIGLTHVTLEDMAQSGATEEDTEGIVDHVRDVESVELAIMIRESSAGAFKVSLRSKQYVDVGAMAHGLGGGGHKFAAGYNASGALDDVIRAILAGAEARLEG